MRKLINARTNQPVPTLPMLNQAALPGDLKNGSMFIGTNNKVYVYIVGTGPVVIGTQA